MSAMHSRSGSLSNISIASSFYVNNTTFNNEDYLNNTTDFDTTIHNNNSQNGTNLNNSDDDMLPSNTLLPNSIFNLIQNVNYKRKSTTTSLLSINSSSTVISLNGPTSKDIPSIKLTHVDSVPSTEFTKYLNDIDAYYEDFNISKSLTVNSLRSLNTVSNEQQEAALDRNNLKHIPEIYFEKDFRLDNPRVFNQIIQVDRSGEFSYPDDLLSSINHDKLQEKLSSYLDIVEVNLINEISNSSDNFFSALDDLKKITSSSNRLKNELKTVDEKLVEFKNTKFQHSKKLLCSVEKYQNTEKFNQILSQISLILTQADQAEQENLKGDYNYSLKIIDSVFALINGNKPPNAMITNITEDWNYPLSNLNRLPALSSLKHQLSNLITDTGKSFAKLFTNILIDDLRATYDNLEHEKYLQSLLRLSSHDPAFFPKAEMTIFMKDKCVEYLTGLTRCGELISAFKLYEEKFHNEVKYILKSNLPSNNEDENNVGNNEDEDNTESRTTNVTNNLSNALALSNLIKSMTPKEFEEMLVNTFTELSIIFKKLVVQKDFLLNSVFDALNNFDSKILKSQPDFLMNLDITKVINVTLNSIQRRIAKIIKIREQQLSSMPLDYFLRFYKLNMIFLADCEMVSKGLVNDSILRDLVNRQLFMYVQSFHKACLKRVVELIELETWKDEGLPISCQDTLDLFYKSSVGDVEENVWFMDLNLNFQYKAQKNLESKLNSEIDTRKTLSFHEQTYILPKATNHLLNILKSYLILIYYYNSSVTNTISQNYLPELLKLMNLKIHQSVLGAQATKTAGLKHVTTKHLALAGEICRFWSIVVLDIERICLTKFQTNKTKSEDAEKIRKTIKKEFQEVRGLFMEQVVDIYNKLIAIMKDTVSSIIDVLSVNDFVKKDANTKATKVNPYMESIVKKTLTIAKSVQRYLPEEEYDGILNRIFEEYEKILSNKYRLLIAKCKGNEKTVNILKAQIQIDLTFFEEKLQDLNETKQIVDNIIKSNGIRVVPDSKQKELSENAASQQNVAENVSNAPKIKQTNGDTLKSEKSPLPEIPVEITAATDFVEIEAERSTAE